MKKILLVMLYIYKIYGGKILPLGKWKYCNGGKVENLEKAITNTVAGEFGKTKYYWSFKKTL